MPKSFKVKTKSRLNAIKHGLYATDSLFLSSLSRREIVIYEQVRASLHEEYKPLTEREKHLVDRLAIHHFRLYRIYDLENLAASKSRDAPLSKKSIIPHLDRFSRFNWRIERQMRMLHNQLYSLYISRHDFSLNLMSKHD
ncbi:hypothetical protein EH220_00885 [bacterium]|nr:MAG: hypothetical protein EH220_00885 [bacterium]